MQSPDQQQVLRIFMIGLPYSGVHQAAQIIQNDYKCQLFNIKKTDKPQNLSLKKYIREQCFKHFRQIPKAVVISQEFNAEILADLKKRNYLNVVLVESSFKKRYGNYLSQKGIQDNQKNMREFMQIDQKVHNADFQNCLQFVRVRIMNMGTLVDLRALIHKKQKQIIRCFRPNWDQYFMKIADIARRRSNCMKTSVGAVIVNDDNRIISTGYNGTPKGLTSCYKMGCDRCNNNQGTNLDHCLCLHAQQSAIIQVGINKTPGCRLYTTYYPCFSCAKIIKQSGIRKIYYIDQYDKKDSGKAFLEQYYKQEDIVKVNTDNLYY